MFEFRCNLYGKEGQLGRMDARRDTAVIPCGLKLDLMTPRWHAGHEPGRDPNTALAEADQQTSSNKTSGRSVFYSAKRISQPFIQSDVHIPSC